MRGYSVMCVVTALCAWLQRSTCDAMIAGWSLGRCAASLSLGKTLPACALYRPRRQWLPSVGQGRLHEVSDQFPVPEAAGALCSRGVENGLEMNRRNNRGKRGGENSLVRLDARL